MYLVFVDIRSARVLLDIVLFTSDEADVSGALGRSSGVVVAFWISALVGNRSARSLVNLVLCPIGRTAVSQSCNHHRAVAAAVIWHGDISWTGALSHDVRIHRVAAG